MQYIVQIHCSEYKEGRFFLIFLVISLGFPRFLFSTNFLVKMEDLLGWQATPTEEDGVILWWEEDKNKETQGMQLQPSLEMRGSTAVPNREELTREKEKSREAAQIKVRQLAVQLQTKSLWESCFNLLGMWHRPTRGG